MDCKIQSTITLYKIWEVTIFLVRGSQLIDTNSFRQDDSSHAQKR